MISTDPTARGPWGRLVLADSLALARSLEDGAVDLVYLDPPFGTGTARAMLRGRGGKFQSLPSPAADPIASPAADRSAGPAGEPGPPPAREAAYADPKADPVAQVELWQEIRRILRPGGAFFLHLDWRTVHQAKLLLDGIFGADNFLNEIIWRYATGGIPKRWFARKHDTILYYVNGPGHSFRRLKEKKYLAHKMSRKGVPEYRDERGWYRYRFLDDVWEIPWLTQDSKERTGYPTQKPVALLGRILEACTDPGDLVADFCSGSGTTAVAALRAGRRWIAGDVSPRAFEIARQRLEEEGAILLPAGDGEEGRAAGERVISFARPAGPGSPSSGGGSQLEIETDSGSRDGREDVDGAAGDGREPPRG